MGRGGRSPGEDACCPVVAFGLRDPNTTDVFGFAVLLLEGAPVAAAGVSDEAEAGRKTWLRPSAGVEATGCMPIECRPALAMVSTLRDPLPPPPPAPAPAPAPNCDWLWLAAAVMLRTGSKLESPLSSERARSWNHMPRVKYVTIRSTRVVCTVLYNLKVQRTCTVQDCALVNGEKRVLLKHIFFYASIHRGLFMIYRSV